MPEAPFSVPLLELEGLNKSIEARYSAVIAAAGDAVAGRHLGDFRRELLDVLAGQSFTWPAFMIWRSYAMQEGWRPLLWQPWMVQPVPSDAVDDEAIARDLRALLGITAMGVAAAADRRTQVVDTMRHRGCGARLVTAGPGASPVCLRLSQQEYRTEVELPRVPVYPGCRCVIACT